MAFDRPQARIDYPQGRFRRPQVDIEGPQAAFFHPQVVTEGSRAAFDDPNVVGDDPQATKFGNVGRFDAPLSLCGHQSGILGGGLTATS